MLSKKFLDSERNLVIGKMSSRNGGDTRYFLSGYFDRSVFPPVLFAHCNSKAAKDVGAIPFEVIVVMKDDLCGIPDEAFNVNGIQCKLEAIAPDMLTLVPDYFSNGSPKPSSPLQRADFIYVKEDCDGNAEKYYDASDRTCEINSRYLYSVGK